MKLSVAHKMMRNNTLNKVHVAATVTTAAAVAEYKYVWKGKRTKSLSVRLCAVLKLTEKKLNWKSRGHVVEGARVPVPRRQWRCEW